MLQNIVFLNYLLYGACFVGGMAILNPFIELWAGKEYVLNIWIVFVHCLNIYLEGMMSPIWTFRSTMGLFLHGRFLPLVAAGINLVASVLLAKCMGLIGVLLGTTVSRLCAGIWPAPFIVYHYGFQKDAKEFYQKWFVNLMIVFVDIGIVYSFSQYFKFSGVIAVVVYGALAVTVFSLSTIIAYYKSSEMKYTMGIVKMLFSKIKGETNETL